MRRAIAAAVMGGLVLGGAAVAPSYAAERGAGKAPARAHRAAPEGAKAALKTAKALKTVVYEGYEFQVPASWPVYRLDEYPQTCVRYDVHAVYLGTPGPGMRCAAGLVGRTQTVSFLPGQGAAAGQGATPGPGAAQAEGATELQGMSAVHGMITQNSVKHELAIAVGTASQGGTVLGTYGTDPAVIEQVLSTLHQATGGAGPTVKTAPGGPAPQDGQRAPLPASPAATGSGPAPLAPASAGNAALDPASKKWHGVPAHWPIEIVQPPQPPGKPRPPQPPRPARPVGGFDSCTAPSVATMSAWRSRYAAVGVYIGGANSGCAYGNLSASWVRTVASAGWGILPIYVGPQAPCWGGSGVSIDPGSAAAQGRAAAADAVSDAQAFGLPAGSPIYYDMEGYGSSVSCTGAVLGFLGAWDRQVNAAGYVTGVYSSQDSGIMDMQTAAAVRTPGFTPPDAIWIALWDNVSSLSDGTLSWPLTDRSKQYAGNVDVTVGGVTLYVDKDIVGGPVAHLRRGTAQGERQKSAIRSPEPPVDS